ncbi:hypothetical protein [Pseudoxanthomonas wuyuanensis]|nr:hypothetical protein [Pseudoxanthomonas wuyuanensis]KAF1714857.1 hypothetical protein CSC75_20140 [Pseudoxanthomonas wuyuanensis]
MAIPPYEDYEAVSMMNTGVLRALSEKWLIVLLLGLVLVACRSKDQMVHNSYAPTPGERFELSESKRVLLEQRASNGDLAAMKELANYYILSVGDEAEGIAWIEKAGDAGDEKARDTVIRFLSKNETPENQARLMELKRRWGR